MLELIVGQAAVAFNPFSAIWEGIKQVLGFIMNSIYLFFDLFGIADLAVCIIVFTIVVYTLLLPFTIKQQRYSKLIAVMNPEIKKITEKYKNKQDQESMLKQNEELKMVYQKYGTSPTGGCLTSFISLPILFALYRVLYNLEQYAPDIKNNSFFGYSKINIQTDSPWNFITSNIQSAFENKDILMIFIMIIIFIIPLLSGLFQYLSTKQASGNTNSSDADNPMASSMKTMMVVMPIFSVYIGYSLPVGVGIYWSFSSLYRIVSQVIINKKMDKEGVDGLIQKNLEKVNKKRKKQGLPPQKMTNVASTKTRNIESPKMSDEEKQKKIQDSTDYYKNQTSNPNSLRAKANMVSQYNERNSKKK